MRRATWTMGLALALAGCAGFGAGAGQGGAPAVPVLDGALHIAAPKGYCPDPQAQSAADDGALLLYGTCQGIEGKGPRAPAPAVLTAAVAPGLAPDTGTLDDAALGALAAYLQTAEGAAALSRGGAGPVSVLSVDQADGLLLVRARDDAGPALAPDYWRGIFAQSGALVTVTVSGGADTPLAATTGRSLTEGFVRAIRAANAGKTAPTPAPDTGSDGPKGLRGLLNRLL